ncbi:uncharacterized protein LOC124808857 [Hydra vulgaris]|uniref:uncharacterized protein LOC124808857 n=1 Tax=Hydra vulgaris TaxID=6087 RepID=UPI0032EA3A49
MECSSDTNMECSSDECFDPLKEISSVSDDEELKSVSRPYHCWNSRTEKLLLERFSKEIERDAMPDQKTLRKFVKESGIGLSYKTVRTKLTNERVKERRLTQKHLNELNLQQ